MCLLSALSTNYAGLQLQDHLHMYPEHGLPSSDRLNFGQMPLLLLLLLLRLLTAQSRAHAPCCRMTGCQLFLRSASLCKEVLQRQQC